jgi:hypothetical protein
MATRHDYAPFYLIGGFAYCTLVGMKRAISVPTPSAVA